MTQLTLREALRRLDASGLGQPDVMELKDAVAHCPALQVIARTGGRALLEKNCAVAECP